MLAMLDRLHILPEIDAALAEGRPVVALESTVIAHGLPTPTNLETADAMEQAVRDGGAVPATIAVLDGRIRIGLDADDKARLTEPGVAKLSRRDLAATLISGAPGATTVSATMICAHAAGIRVFATGGIGGVHRGAQDSMDISADLLELGRTPVLTVSSGAKSILDLPRTLEYLETQGVPVLGYGTDSLPAFHSRESGLPVDRRVDSADDAACIADLHWQLGLGGLLLCNPVPEDAALPGQDVDAWTDAALALAAEAGISGKAVTPYLLSQVAEASEGKTLRANTALLVDNARLGAAVAVALSRLHS